MPQPFSCRSCSDSDLEVFLRLGASPLANALLRPDQLSEVELRFPLDVAFCRACALVQLTHTVPPEDLFVSYPYFSSVSETMVLHAHKLSTSLVSERRLNADSLVVELASNDGYLLQHYRNLGVPVLGIEPAENIAPVAEAAGIPTICRFFSTELALELREQGRLADIVHAHNVLAHVPALNDFVHGIATILKPDGVCVIEVPYVRDLIDLVEFDTIYHEHLSYFSLAALIQLFQRHALTIVDVERQSIHGGTLRIFSQPADTARDAVSPRVSQFLESETQAGMLDAAFYEGFGRRVSALKHQLIACLAESKASGKTVVGYGASAKGTTMLNYCGIGSNFLDYIVDRSPVKQGNYAPGTKLPIYAPSKLLETKPDLVLLLTWNFATEILEQQSEYRRLGGKFVIPVPEVTIV